MLTEELERSLTRTHKVRPSRQKIQFPWKPLVKEIRVGFIIMVMSFLLASLMHFERTLLTFARVNFQEFHWLVMAQGDQVAIDEVGRFLRQLDGATKVEFFSSTMLLDKMEKDGLSPQDLNLMKAASLPPAWKITWADSTNFTKLMNESLPDVKNFPAVVDVAFDSDVLKDFQRAQALGLKVRACLSGVLFLSAFAGLLLLGQILFFTVLNKKLWAQVWPYAVSGLVFWALGGLFFIGTLGALQPTFWAIGLFSALIRSMFQLLALRD